MSAILEDGKLRLTGYVGEYYYSDGFTAADVIVALSQVDADAELDVHLNSGGGIATEGAAIHALLSARAGTTNIIVEGIAASAASLIAMAGDRVTMTAGSVMMIHDPSGYTSGDAAEHTKTIEALHALATSYARVYAQKSGKTAEDCREIMKSERWFTPDEAVAEGFADVTLTGKSKQATAFDYRIFAHAPEALVALAENKQWSMTKYPPKPDTDSSSKDTTMTDKERADKAEKQVTSLTAQIAQLTASSGNAVKEALDRRSAIMSLDEAKGQEKLAEHLFNIGNSLEDAKATLSAAVGPAGEQGEYHPPQRLMMNAQGLNSAPANDRSSKGGLSARMDARAAKMKK